MLIAGYRLFKAHEEPRHKGQVVIAIQKAHKVRQRIRKKKGKKVRFSSLKRPLVIGGETNFDETKFPPLEVNDITIQIFKFHVVYGILRVNDSSRIDFV